MEELGEQPLRNPGQAYAEAAAALQPAAGLPLLRLPWYGVVYAGDRSQARLAASCYAPPNPGGRGRGNP